MSKKKHALTATKLAVSIIAQQLIKIDGKKDLSKLTELVDTLFHAKIMLEDTFNRLTLLDKDNEIVEFDNELDEETRHAFLGIDALNNSEHRASIRGLLIAEGIDGCALFGLFGNEEDHEHQ